MATNIYYVAIKVSNYFPQQNGFIHGKCSCSNSFPEFQISLHFPLNTFLHETYKTFSIIKFQHEENALLELVM